MNLNLSLVFLFHSMKNLRKIFQSIIQRKYSYSREFLLLLSSSVIVFGLLVEAPALKHFPVDGTHDFLLMAFTWLFITLMSGMIIFVLLLNKWIFAFLYPIYILASGTISFYISQYNLVFNGAIVESTLNTNNFEAFSQISTLFLGYLALLLAISLLLVFKRLKIETVIINWSSFFIVLAGLTIIFFMNTSRVISMFYYSPYALFFGLDECLVEEDELPKVREDICRDAVCNSDSITVVFVVGEAMRADHLSLNGYHRNTFSLMATENPISYKNIYSEWSYTIKSLPHIFTRADSINHWPSTNEKTFISIFNSCNYRSWWIGNQDLNKYLLPLASECDSLNLFSFSKDNKRFDGKMLPSIREAIDSPYSRKLIVVHQFGCHWWYPSNIPKEFEKFTPVMKSKNITQNDSLKIVNSYDNVICYTDFFLSQIVCMLKNKKAVLIFLSDHGELLGEDRKWFHAQQTKYEMNPACLVWFSDEYARLFPDKVVAATENKDKHFRTDFLFHTILEAGEIETSVKVEQLNILSDRN